MDPIVTASIAEGVSAGLPLVLIQIQLPIVSGQETGIRARTELCPGC